MTHDASEVEIRQGCLQIENVMLEFLRVIIYIRRSSAGDYYGNSENH